jgi:hypothetical protein
MGGHPTFAPNSNAVHVPPDNVSGEVKNIVYSAEDDMAFDGDM